MLLSIIIPTKNRQNTAIYAIESAARIEASDFEIIVEDCSDTEELGELLQRKFHGDQRIKYSHSNDNPSMTENWNRALDRAAGDYLCGIGDDDAVLEEIYQIVQWAKNQDMDALVHCAPYSYTWPGFYEQRYDGTFVIWKDFSGNADLRSDYQAKVIEFGKMTNPMAYIDLPAIYHSLVSRRLLNKVRQETGKILDSTSLDIYTAIVFSKFISEYVYVDYPFTVKGASPKSNSQRLFTGKARDHFDEFKNLNFPELLPAATTLSTTVAESFIKACRNTQREDLISLIDLPVFYANVAKEDPTSLEECKKKLNQFAPGAENKFRFDEILKKKRNITSLKRVGQFIKQKIPFVIPIYRRLFSKKESILVFQSNNILVSLDLHKNYVADKKIVLNLSGKSKPQNRLEN